MPATILKLAEIDDPSVGGKALGLARLTRMGLNVPPALVIANAEPGDYPAGLAEACAQLGEGALAVRSSARDKKLVLARQCAMYLAREVAEKPLRDIALYFGGRNHSTVIHSCRRFQERLATDVALGKELREILQRLGIPADQMLITC